MASVLLGLSVFYVQAPAMADGGFLECVGSGASAGYPVPQPSPDPSASVTPDPSPSASDAGPSADSGSLYGVFIKPERQNHGLLSADIYLLSARGAWIKQVGHAELDRPSGEPLVYQSDSSSPFPFQLTLSDGQASLVQATLFSGSSLSNLTLDCRGARHGR